MMQPLVTLRGITKAFADRTVLHDINLQIQLGDRVGIVGPNGAGKTTLLNVIVGSIQPDAGTVRWEKEGCSYHYMTQSRQETMGLKDDGLSGEFLVATKRLGLRRDVTNSDETRLDSVSGGERTKLALAKAWSTRAHLLILDEPTNHLDADGIQWLIGEIKRYPGAVLIVSHDRYFLDETVNRIVELRDGRARLYNGNYSDYVAERDRQRQAELHQYETQQKEQERIERQIVQLKQWAEKGHRQAGKQGTLSERRQMGYKQYHRAKAKKLAQRVKSQIHRLEKLRSETIAKPREDERIHFDIGDAKRHGRCLIEARRLGKQFGDHALFLESDFFIQRGERVGLVGGNGCGKTTLLKMILGEEPVTDGQLWVSPTARIAYLSQSEDLPVGETFMDMTRDFTIEQRTTFRTTLANMGFTEEKLSTPISQLSLGERTRLKLAWLVLQDYNLLILDEPTNHLDVTSREELERALESYQGTLLLVTHDRYLMERICDKLLVFSQQRVQRIESGLKEFLRAKEVVHVQNSMKRTKAERKEELMILETRIAQLLGDLCTVPRDHQQYQIWDSELNALMKRRNQILAGKSL
jgi:macrolide transport system ATP-binding/permease protein